VVTTAAGRGRQLAAGAAAGNAPWLLFLHADTTLGPGWAIAARGFMTEAANAARAGYFRLQFDSRDPRARRVERLVAWRCRTFGLPYGDQGLLMTRAFYQRLGGFDLLPLMEDVDLVRRIGRVNLVPLDAVVVASARRYERDGWLLRPLRNLSCLALFSVGVPLSVGDACTTDEASPRDLRPRAAARQGQTPARRRNRPDVGRAVLSRDLDRRDQATGERSPLDALAVRDAR
jgi:hypothetical protein